MDWKLILLICYLVVYALVCLRIVFETRSSTKTMAYLMICTFIPVFGILFYLAFGINYWKKKIYNRKKWNDEIILKSLQEDIESYNEATLKKIEAADDERGELAAMLIKDIQSPLTRNNSVKLLMNGEEKFPEVMQAMKEARDHIHIEYYIFEQDTIGTAIIDLMILKAREGVKVRFIYDDFGSPSIKGRILKRMREAGVEVFPFYKVHFYLLANRLNYRNHRKIIVIDGKTGFVGGINVSDKYINSKAGELYWRDSHVRIDGPGVYYLQYLFLTDWNFCCPDNIKPENFHFTPFEKGTNDTFLQIVGGGPDSFQPSIMFSILQAINLAREEILLTTPYFIPNEGMVDALRIAALSGLSVKLLVPGKSDLHLVNAAARAHYTDLLLSGVEIYQYQKGFIHSKTMVTDNKLSIIGTANMDNRSFELNFEVNAIIYDTDFSSQLKAVFMEDIKDAVKVDPAKWIQRSAWVQLPEKLARLLSPSL